MFYKHETLEIGKDHTITLFEPKIHEIGKDHTALCSTNMKLTFSLQPPPLAFHKREFICTSVSE